MRPAVLVSLTALMMLLGGVVGNSSLHAQALPTATKAAEITAFGGYSVTSTDFGGLSKEGFLTGADFTLFPRWHFDPSAEVRYTQAHGEAISEHSILVGPRLQKDLRGDRVHPYVDVLFGRGTIDYHPALGGYTANWGSSFAPGVGVDFDITRHVSLKADFTQQFWNLGKSSYFKPQGGDYTLTPRSFTIGATYHFQFRGLNKQQELR